ncbi:MAG: chromosomal replication initiator DnaA [Pseudomonadota bacterium]
MTSARQIPLELPVRPARGREDFFVSASNALALAQIEAWRDWPQGRLALVGPGGAGKSHLAAVWAQETGAEIVPAADLPGRDLAGLAARGAVAVEDADRDLDPAGETALFHLHNRLAAAGGALLLTARTPPGRWPVALPDLATRLAAIAVARLEPPDDALREALVVKLFADRGVGVEPGLPRYLAQRAPRSHAALARAVAEIDRAALAAGRRPSRRLAGDVLARLDGGAD